MSVAACQFIKLPCGVPLLYDQAAFLFCFPILIDLRCHSGLNIVVLSFCFTLLEK